MASAFEKMDKMYRHQRYFYDLTRKYYLLGRDKLINEMKVGENEHVLEVGCGTGRNLRLLGKKHPGVMFYGLDASAAMLATAQSKIDSANLRNVSLKTALADDYGYRETFGIENPFDSIYFSYSISMIPAWKESIQTALKNLKSGRSLYIVDFYDQRDLPKPFRKILCGWLKQFHVKYPAELIPYLRRLEGDDIGELSMTSIYKSYSFIAKFRKA
ncbi:MAG: methyltransferase [Pyrinomonadaceae bacterium]|nr:methyltransferase [Pyrinomonadaceae bacterium]